LKTPSELKAAGYALIEQANALIAEERALLMDSLVNSGAFASSVWAYRPVNQLECVGGSAGISKFLGLNSADAVIQSDTHNCVLLSDAYTMTLKFGSRESLVKFLGDVKVNLRVDSVDRVIESQFRAIVAAQNFIEHLEELRKYAQ